MKKLIVWDFWQLTGEGIKEAKEKVFISLGRDWEIYKRWLVRPYFDYLTYIEMQKKASEQDKKKH